MKEYKIKINEKSFSVSITETTFGEVEEVKTDKTAVVETVKAPEPKSTPTGDGKKLTAPMPGTVLKIKVSNGSAVKVGDPIVILEAMKMENEIAANVAGKVTLCVNEGDKVNSGDIIATIA